MPWRYYIRGATHEAIFKLSSEIQTVSELKVVLEKISDMSSTGPINKSVLVEIVSYYV